LRCSKQGTIEHKTKTAAAPRSIGPQVFIGEMAFLLHQPASATVTVSAGARYVT